jgi:hypothetical protein
MATEPAEAARWAAALQTFTDHTGLIQGWVTDPVITVILGNGEPLPLPTLADAESAAVTLDETAKLLGGLGWRPCE